jgi:hypothetical protein
LAAALRLPLWPRNPDSIMMRPLLILLHPKVHHRDLELAGLALLQCHPPLMILLEFFIQRANQNLISLQAPSHTAKLPQDVEERLKLRPPPPLLLLLD